MRGRGGGAVAWSGGHGCDRQVTTLRVLVYHIPGSGFVLAVQRISRILWNPRLQCRVHKSPPFGLLRSQTKPLQVISCSFFKIHFSNMLPLMSRTCRWCFLQVFLPKHCISLSSRACHMPSPSHPPFDAPNYLVISTNYEAPCCAPLLLAPHSPHYLPQHCVLEHSQPVVTDQVSHPYAKQQARLHLCMFSVCTS